MEDTNRMPIYVYERPWSRFEIRQGFNDNALTEDPEMGVPVRRIMQPSPIIFKGSGWYKTDSRTTSSNGAKSESESKAPEAATASASEDKSEKPAETTSAKEAVSEATAKTTTEIKKTAEKPATPRRRPDARLGARGRSRRFSSCAIRPWPHSAMRGAAASVGEGSGPRCADASLSTRTRRPVYRRTCR